MAEFRPGDELIAPESPCLGIQELGYAACVCMQQNVQLVEVEDGLLGAEPCLIEERKQLKARVSDLENANTGLVKELAQKEAESKEDMLTGLQNSRALPEQFEKHVQSGEKFGILFIDIENFKQINKSGHLAGDYALQYISNVLQLEFREEDLVFALQDEEEIVIRDKTGDTSIIFRKGGDEFILFINHPEVDEAMMEGLGERFRNALLSRNESRNYNVIAPVDKQLGVHAKGMVYDPENPFTLETVLSQGDPKGPEVQHGINQVELIFRGAKMRTDAEVAHMLASRAKRAEQHRRLDDES